jgi:HMG (high mobility group) box
MTEEKQGKKGRASSNSKSPAQGGKKKADDKKQENPDDNKLKPTKPLSPYIYFTTENVPKIRIEKNCSNVDAMREAGARWNQLSEEEKSPYQQKSI